MTRFLLNTALALFIAVGGFSLSTAPAAAAVSAAAECEDGWKLQCDGNVCCTTCQDGGEIGQCKAVE